MGLNSQGWLIMKVLLWAMLGLVFFAAATEVVLKPTFNCYQGDVLFLLRFSEWNWKGNRFGSELGSFQLSFVQYNTSCGYYSSGFFERSSPNTLILVQDTCKATESCVPEITGIRNLCAQYVLFDITYTGENSFNFTSTRDERPGVCNLATSLNEEKTLASVDAKDALGLVCSLGSLAPLQLKFSGFQPNQPVAAGTIGAMANVEQCTIWSQGFYSAETGELSWSRFSLGLELQQCSTNQQCQVFGSLSPLLCQFGPRVTVQGENCLLSVGGSISFLDPFSPNTKVYAPCLVVTPSELDVQIAMPVPLHNPDLITEEEVLPPPIPSASTLPAIQSFPPNIVATPIPIQTSVEPPVIALSAGSLWACDAIVTWAALAVLFAWHPMKFHFFVFATMMVVFVGVHAQPGQPGYCDGICSLPLNCCVNDPLCFGDPTCSSGDCSQCNSASCCAEAACQASTNCCDATCATCSVGSNSNACTSCSGTRYLLDGTCITTCPSYTYPSESHICDYCRGYCLTCNGPTSSNCTACSPPRTLQNGECVLICSDPNCAICSDPATCSQCKQGAFLYQAQCVQSCPESTYPSFSQCKPCSSGCQSCYAFGDTYCNSCRSTYRLEGTTCKPICDDIHCADCFDYDRDFCNRCEENYYLFQGTCIAACPAGFYPSQTGGCSRCHSGCATCMGILGFDCTDCTNPSCISCLSTNKAICTRCHQGSPSGGTCINCPQFCSSCSPCVGSCDECQTTCNQCNDGYYWSISTCSCEPCHSSCSKCNGGTKSNCTTCSIDKILSNGECLSCPNNCHYCNACEIGCGSCQTPCSHCYDGYYWDQASCACIPCHTSCVKCNGPSTSNCLECPHGSFLENGECIVGPLPTTCLQNCLACSTCETECGSCQKTCSQCNDGYYWDQASCKCKPCHTWCAKCNGPSSDNCIDCAYDELLVNGRCIACPPNCATCDICGTNCGRCGITTCSQCRDHHYFDAFLCECKPCHDSCLSCSGPFAIDCTLCSEGLFKVGTQCLPCPSNCLACSACGTECGSCSFTCTQCRDGYYWNITLCQCQPCDTSCFLCSGPTAIDCTLCSEGFFKVGTQCLPCPSNCLACSTCGTECGSCALPCTKCRDGYYWNITLCQCQPCDTSCFLCSGPTASECTKCPFGVPLENGECKFVCGIRGYLDTANNCGFCYADCMSCVGPENTDCTSCVNGRTLRSGTSVGQCKPGLCGDAICNTDIEDEDNCTEDCYCTLEVKDPGLFRCRAISSDECMGKAAADDADCIEIKLSVGCFASNSRVSVSRNGTSMELTLEELQIGDQITTLDSSGQIIYTKVYYLAHSTVDLQGRVLIMTITDDISQWELHVTPNHLVYAWSDPVEISDLDQQVPVAAQIVKPGWWVLTCKDSHRKFARVLSVTLGPQTRVLSPVTSTGTALVEGLYVSVFDGSKFDHSTLHTIISILQPITPDYVHPLIDFMLPVIDSILDLF